MTAASRQVLDGSPQMLDDAGNASKSNPCCEREAAYLEHTGVAALDDCCLMVQALDVSLQLLNVV